MSNGDKNRVFREVYAARPFFLRLSPRIALARSEELAPNNNRELTSRSIETDGSPASILATRDWLDWRRLANSIWDSPCCFLRARRLRLSASFISIRTASASDRPRNSFTVPTVHPAASSRAFLPFLMSSSLSEPVVLAKSSLTSFNHRCRCLSRLLRENIEDNYSVRIHSIQNTESAGFIVHSQFMTSASNNRHGPRVRKFEQLSFL